MRSVLALLIEEGALLVGYPRPCGGDHGRAPPLSVGAPGLGRYQSRAHCREEAPRIARRRRHRNSELVRMEQWVEVPGQREGENRTAHRSVDSLASLSVLNSLPARDHWNGSDPWRAGAGCENTPSSKPLPGPRPGGSLPSTSVLPSAAPATGWRRTQLQATARDR